MAVLPQLLVIAFWIIQASHAYILPQQEILKDNGDAITSSTIRETLKDNEIIPQVLDDFEPSYILDIVYGRTKKHPAAPVELGNDIPVSVVSKRPTFSFRSVIPPPSENNDASDPSNTLSTKNWTLILTDPDALSRAQPNKSEMCHWIITNIKFKFPFDLESALTAMARDESEEPIYSILPTTSDKPSTLKSHELESYYPPAPPPKTGAHRYVFVLLEGSGGKHGIQKPGERPHWGYGKDRHGVRDWANENGLKVVGANFFFAQSKKQ